MNAQNGNNNFFDLLNLLSLMVSLQNLRENEQQSAYNDVHKANDKQAQFLLQEINRQFQEQNQMLTEIKEKLDYVYNYINAHEMRYKENK